MKNILFVLLIILFLSINAKVVKRPSCPAPFVDERCVNSNNRVTTKVHRLCVKKRFGVCSTRTRCCLRIRKCRNGSCKSYRPKCKWVGRSIRRKNCGKQVCKVNHYINKCQLRKRCCNTKGKRCRWVGPVTRVATCKPSRVCSTRRISKCLLRRRCCNRDGKKCTWGKKIKTGECNGAICSLRKVGKCLLRKECCLNKKCRFYGKTFLQNTDKCKPTVCKYIRTGKCTRRKRCCKGRKCKWEGKNKKIKCIKEVCSKVSFSKCTQRKRCCNKKGKKCRWVGPKLSKKCVRGKTVCSFKRRGKCSKRKLCCTNSKCCGNRKCRWVGKKISMNCVKERCVMTRYKNCLLRKRCCNQKGKSCRWSGKPIAYNCKKVCVMKKINKCQNRKQCCQKDGSNCSFVGKPVSNGRCSTKLKCSNKSVGNCKQRVYCCRGTKRGRKCFWRGKATKRKNCKLPEDCVMRKTGKCTVRRQCCLGKNCRWAGNDVRVQGCRDNVKNQPCVLYADPHARSLRGINFEAQKVGDFLLYKGDNLEVHYRAKSMGRWSAVIKLGVIVDGVKFISIDTSLNIWSVNGVQKRLQGTMRLRSATVTKNGNTFVVNTHQGETFQAVTHNSYIDTYLTSNLGGTTGLCSQQFIQSRFFNHPQKDENININIKNCPKRKRFVKHCQSLRLGRQRTINCVFDLCNKMRIDMVDDIIDEVNVRTTKCRMIKIGKCFERKKCCLRKNGKTNKCKWVGKKIMVANCKREVCLIRRISKCSVRKYCCKNKKCRWVGKEIKEARCQWITGKKTCQLKRIGKCTVRRHCCVVKRGRRSCKFEGKAKREKNCGKTTCRYFSVGPCLERRQCCTNGKCVWEGHNRRLTPCNPPVTRTVTCHSYADPHMIGFKRNAFEAQHAGTFTLYAGEKLYVSYHSVRIGAWAAIKTVNVRVNGQTLHFSTHFTQPFGRKNLNGAAFVSRNGNRITVSTGEGEEIDIVTHGQFLDVFVRTNKSNVGGLCADGKQHSQPQINHCPQRAKNTVWCRKRNPRNLNQCVFDLCQGLARREEIKIKREVRRENKKKIKINWRIWNHRKVTPRKPTKPKPRRPTFKPKPINKPRPVFRPRPFFRPRPVETPRRPTPTPTPVVRRPTPTPTPTPTPRPVFRPPAPTPRPVFRPAPTPRPVFRPPPPPVFRPAPRRMVVRRGRGDVWLKTRGGKWVDVNVQGTFEYLKDSKIGLKIDVQFSKYRRGSVISEVALIVKDKTIIANRNGEVMIDGETVEHESAIIDFSNNNLKVYNLDGKPGIYEFRGLSRDRLSIEYEKETRSYMIAIGTLEKHHVGLYADPENPKNHVLKETESVFANYIPYKKIKQVRPTRRQLKRALRCCRVFRGIKRKECMSDFIRTKRCLKYLLDERPHVRKTL